MPLTFTHQEPPGPDLRPWNALEEGIYSFLAFRQVPLTPRPEETGAAHQGQAESSRNSVPPSYGLWRDRPEGVVAARADPGLGRNSVSVSLVFLWVLSLQPKKVPRKSPAEGGRRNCL